MKRSAIARALFVTGGLLALLIFFTAACGPVEEPPMERTLSEDRDDGNKPTVSPTAINNFANSSSPSPRSTTVTEAESSQIAVETDPARNESGAGAIQLGFTADGHPFMGDPAAPIVMKEFSDFQCPYCGRFYAETLPSIESDLIGADEVLLIYYDLPLESIHPQAFAAANAGRCAGEQGAAAFWSMHDLLFEGTQQWSLADPLPIFISYAGTIELDTDAFEECYDSNRYEASIREDIALATANGITGTPSFLINEQLFVGAQPLAQFNEAIAIVNNGGQLADASPTRDSQQAPAAPTPAIISDAFASDLGDPNAPIKIVEFTDYQCPYCSRHSLETLPLIIRDLIDSGRVYYQLKDLPLEQLHQNARLAATAARCAGVQEGYWEMHDILFSNQSEWSDLSGAAAADNFLDYADELGLDRDSFSSCLDDSDAGSAIDDNIAEARALGVDSTPYFFIDGFPLSGARPYEHFEYAVSLAEEGRLAEAYVPSEPEPQGPAEIPTESAYSIGAPDAPVTIIEYTDYQCPYCSRHFNQTYHQIVDNFVETGTVRYVIKDFPLSNIHPQAAKAAEAARCAGDQGEYFSMHDVLFQRQESWSGGDPSDQFLSYAEELGLDVSQFSECLASGQHEEAVQADLQEGITFGVTGTPAFFINGYLLSGAQPYALFEQAINSFLENQN